MMVELVHVAHATQDAECGCEEEGRLNWGATRMPPGMGKAGKDQVTHQSISQQELQGSSDFLGSINPCYVAAHCYEQMLSS